MQSGTLDLSCALPVQGMNAGMVVSRGDGIHITRVCDIFDLLFVRDGVLSVQEEDKVFEVGPGQSLLLWPGRLHFGTKIYPPNLRYFWLHFVLQPVQVSTGDFFIPQFTTVARPDSVTELFLRYIDHQETRRNDPLLSNILLTLILREIGSQPQPEQSDSTSTFLAGKAHDYIRTHYREQLTTSRIANEVGCNPQYLSRIFRKVYNQTITDSIHEAQMEYARRLLVDTSMSIKEIAFICGFADSRYFYRIFRRREGMTALAFRRMNTHTFINVE